MYQIKHMDELIEWSEMLGCTYHEAAYYMLAEFFEAAGFPREPLYAELNSMTEEKLYEVFDWWFLD